MVAGPRALAMRGVEKRFGALQALCGVDLELEPGEVHALVGENGAGKSTLMKILAGVFPADAGTLEVAGAPYRPAGPRAARARGVAMIYQELALAPHLSVAENITLGSEDARLGWRRQAAQRRRVAAALEALAHPEITPERRLGELSSAARQLVEIARALAGDARVLVLDEPTSSLARDDAERLFGVLRRLADTGVAVVYISHFLEELPRVARRYTVLRDGRSVASGELAQVSQQALVRHMAGRALDQVYPRVPHEPGAIILEIEGLSGRRLPQRASLVLRRGEILGLAGLVGAGRSELLRAIFGLEPVRAGRVRVAGIELARTGARERWANGLGLVSEDRAREGLLLARPVAWNLALSSLERLARRGWLRPGALEREASRWIERLGVRCRDAQQSVRELSGGNQQKVALGRLCLHDVDVFLLDEPTRGIDVASKAELYRWIGRLAAEGKALLFCSSYFPELLGVCDRIAVMHRGLLGPARPVGEWSEESLLAAATLGAQA